MAKQYSTVSEFIQYGKVNPNNFANGTIEFQGFNSVGDGGASIWQRTEVTGLTPSQTPTDLDDNKFTDSIGDQWELVPSQIITFNGVQFLPLPFGASGNGGYYFNSEEFIYLVDATAEALAAEAAAARAEAAAASFETPIKGDVTGRQLGEVVYRNSSSISLYKDISGLGDRPSSISASGTYKVVTRIGTTVISGIQATDITMESFTSNTRLVLRISTADASLIDDAERYELAADTSNTLIQLNK